MTRCIRGKNWNNLVLLGVLGVFLLVLFPLVEGESMGMTVELDPSGFAQVKHMTAGVYDESPSRFADVTWRGITINAPARVIVHFDKDEDKPVHLDVPIPFTAYFKLCKPEVNLVGRATLVMKDEQTQEERRASVTTIDGERRLNLPGIAGDADPTEAAGTFFSYHITRYIDLPVKSATYAFWLEVGSVKSNNCRIQVIVE